MRLPLAFVKFVQTLITSMFTVGLGTFGMFPQINKNNISHFSRYKNHLWPKLDLVAYYLMLGSHMKELFFVTRCL